MIEDFLKTKWAMRSDLFQLILHDTGRVIPANSLVSGDLVRDIVHQCIPDLTAMEIKLNGY